MMNPQQDQQQQQRLHEPKAKSSEWQTIPFKTAPFKPKLLHSSRKLKKRSDLQGVTPAPGLNHLPKEKRGEGSARSAEAGISGAGDNYLLKTGGTRKMSYSAVLATDERLAFLKCSLHTAWQLGFQSEKLHAEILSVIDSFRHKIATVPLSQNIWQPTPIAPASSTASPSLLYKEKTNIPAPLAAWGGDVGYAGSTPGSPPFVYSSFTGVSPHLHLTPIAPEVVARPVPVHSLPRAPFIPQPHRLLRARSTSWSTPLRLPDLGFSHSPKRLLSPAFEKRGINLEDITLKQEKAQEMRELINAAKSKKQVEKAQAIQTRLAVNESKSIASLHLLKQSIDSKLQKAEKVRLYKQSSKGRKTERKLRVVEEEGERREKLREALDEKLEKADKVRGEILGKIREKARAEINKGEDVVMLTQILLQNKKIEVEQKLQDSEQRKLDLEDEKMRKAKETNQLLQESATKRRLEMRALKEEKVALKAQIAKERVEGIELERKEKIAKQLVKTEEAQTRMRKRNAQKLKEEEEKKNALCEKLELSAKRKDAKLLKVREKAALANLNAKIVANRVVASRRQSFGGDEIVVADGLLTPTFEALVLEGEDFKAIHKKLKKIKSRLVAIGKEYVFDSKCSATSSVEKQEVGRRLASLNSVLVQSLTLLPNEMNSNLPPAAGSLLQTFSPSFCSFLSSELESDYIYSEVCTNGTLDRLVSHIFDLQLASVQEFSFIQPSLAILESFLMNERCLAFFCQGSASSLPLKLLDLLARLVPFCSSAKPNADELLSSMSIFRIFTKCIELTKTEPSVQRVVHQLIYHSFTNGVFDQLQTLFGLVHGTAETLDSFVPFIIAVADMVDSIVSLGNEKFFEMPIQAPRKIPQESATTLSFILSTSLLNLITLLDSVLLSMGGSYRISATRPISPHWATLSLLLFQIFNKLCRIRLDEVQEWMVGQDGLVTELFHLMLFWMHFDELNGRPVDAEKLIDEIVISVGYVCHNHPKNTTMVCMGLPGKSILQRLCLLPFRYFNTPRGQAMLFPTLAVLAGDANNRAIIEEDVSMDMLQMYFEKGSFY